MKLMIRLIKNARGFHNPVFIPSLNPNTLPASLRLAGWTMKLTRKYATTHRIGHIRKQISTGIPIGVAKIRGIIILIIRLMKKATGLNNFIVYIFDSFNIIMVIVKKIYDN